MRRPALALAAILAAVLPARADIVIGVAGPMTGEFAPLGAQMRAGVEQAVADVNAAGGVAGQKLTLEVADDGCNAKKADAAASALAAKGAVMVVGHLCLKASLAGSAVYATEHVIEISPGTTFAKYTDDRPSPGIFRLCGRDDAEGAFAGAMIARRFASQNIAVIDDGTAYGKSLADAAASAIDAAGRPIVLRDAYTPGAKEYNTLASRIAAASADVVYLGGSNPEAAIIAKSVKERNAAVTIVGGDALLTSDYPDLAGVAAEGTLVTYPADARSFPEATAVAAALKAKGTEPAGYTLPAYAAVQTWAAAATAAGGAEFDKVVAALHSSPFNTVIGSVAFDEKGDLRDPRYDWYVWKDGDYAPAGF
ncbi:MAG TPA: branched-chain amino acid ABC transporter substrate-binding protein [Bauldia sp.]|nr:branched-chain amino acid ABC transporter substrate-binding protein [Bauldia sp.]